MAQIIVNDNHQDVELPLTLSELIRLNDIEQPDMVSVQINGDFIEREKFSETQINDGDTVDFLYFMGGGSK